MIVLITGKPGIGKSTAIDHFVHNYHPKHWVVTNAITIAPGLRSGFIAINSDGVRRVISHKTDIQSNAVVGENHVDIDAVNQMFAAALNNVSANYITVVDEIGPIQMLSEAFATQLNKLFSDPDSDLFASIHYKDESLAPYRQHDAAILLQVTIENRDAIPSIVAKLFKHKQQITALSQVQLLLFKQLLQEFLDSDKSVQLSKLLDSSLEYATTTKVTTAAEVFTYKVTGKHGEYTVLYNGVDEHCDCDLFNGNGQYEGAAGTCSHIMAVRLFLA